MWQESGPSKIIFAKRGGNWVFRTLRPIYEELLLQRWYQNISCVSLGELGYPKVEKEGLGCTVDFIKGS